MTQSSPETAKKSKASKKLKFDEPGEEFILKPRRPITRKQVKEALSKIEAIEKVRKNNASRTIITSQGDNIAVIKSQLEATKYEIAKLKQAIRKHADVYKNYRKALWKGTETFQNQLNLVVDGHAQFHTWTVPAIKEA